MKFSMIGRLNDCLLLTYRTPAESVQDLLPPGLELVTRRGFAYWNILVSEVGNIRPLGMPAVFGVNYHHIAYRLHVRTEEMEGLFFVRSDADHRLVAAAGNWITDFRIHRANIRMTRDRILARTKGGVADAVLQIRPGGRIPTDPLLRYRSKGLSMTADGRLRLAEVFRNEAEWRESPVRVVEAKWSYFDYLLQHEVSLVRATRVAPINYRWRLGRTLDLRRRPYGEELAVSGRA